MSDSGLADGTMAASGVTRDSKANGNGKGSEKIDSKEPETVEMEDDDEDCIDEEQLQEYQEMVEQLGTFPVSSNVFFSIYN